jgi:hypothetical protein
MGPLTHPLPQVVLTRPKYNLVTLEA